MNRRHWISLSSWILCAAACGCATSSRTSPPPGESEGTKNPAASPAAAKEALPSSGERAEQIRERAVAAWKKGDLAAAERELSEAVERDPKMGWAWASLGAIAERRGDSKLAESHYRKALAAEPTQPLAWESLARMYCRQKRAQALDAELAGAMSRARAEEGPALAFATLALCRGDFPEAEQQAKARLRQDQKDVRAMHLLARVYLKQGKLELAKMVLDSASAIAPDEPELWNAQGLVQLGLSSRAKAQEAFEKAVALRPAFPEAENNLGALLNEAEQYEKAAEHLRAAVAAAPDFAKAQLNLGNAYRGLGEFQLAQQAYEAALKLSPGLADAYYNLALLHLDSEVPNVDLTERMNRALAYFRDFQERGGKDDRLAQYVKDAKGRIERESRRKERERKDQKKAQAGEPRTKTESKKPPAETPSAKPKASSGKLTDLQP